MELLRLPTLDSSHLPSGPPSFTQASPMPCFSALQGSAVQDFRFAVLGPKRDGVAVVEEGYYY